MKRPVFWLLAVVLVLLTVDGAMAATYYDVPTQTMGSSGSFAQCVYVRYNGTEPITVFGFTKHGSTTATRGFFYNGSAAPDNPGNCATGNASYIASCTFSGNNCYLNTNITTNVGQNWTFAIDNAGAAWNQNYGTAGQLPAYGNTSKVRWQGAGSNGGGPYYLDGTPRSITGIYFTGPDAPAGPNVITVNLSNVVNGSSWPSSVTFSNLTGNLSFAYFNITGTGYCVTLTGNGTSTNCTTTGSGTSTFFNVSNNSISVTGSQTVSAGTYQAILNVSAYRLFLNTSIASFNGTNNQADNTTTNGLVQLYALNGTNNVKIDVAGNYSKNITCTVNAPLSTSSCNATGIYDDAFTIGASYNGVSILSFNISVQNSTLGGVLYNQSTTNGSLVFALLQGYNYLFNFRAVNYTSQNVTIPANASTNRYNFTSFLSREVRFIFRDEITREIIDSTNMTLEIISDIYADNVSTTNGTIVETLLFPTEYLFRYRGGTYTERQYFLNVTDETNTNLTLYVIDLNESDLVTVTITDTGGNILEGATGKLLRYFLYCNCYEIVEMERSGPDGTANFWVQPIEGHYKWSVDYDGSNYFLSSSPETITTTEKFFSIDLGQNYYASYRALSSIGTVVTVNATTGAIAFSWSDPTGIVTEGCLTTYRFIGVIETQTNQSCASGTTGGVVIVINTTDNRRYKYVASLDTSAAYSDHIVYTGYFDPDFSIDFGVTGQYLAMILVVILAIVFSFSAAAVLISVSISLVIVSALGLITFTTGFIAGVAALFAGLAIFLLRS